MCGNCKCGHGLSDSAMVKAAGAKSLLTELAQIVVTMVSKLTRVQFAVQLLTTTISDG